MASPTFIGIGPGRSGSSWLHQVLASHPDICMGRSKETEFFNTHFDRGRDWYESFFEDCVNARAIGEISNNYYLDPEVARRIRAYSAEIKLIINLRDPFDLLASFYGFGLRRGLDPGSLQDALNLPVGLFMGSGYGQREKAGSLTVADQVPLLESVLLAERLEPFLEEFPAKQVCFVIFEQLKRDPLQIVRKVYRFLRVDADHEPPMANKIVNPTIVPRVRAIGVLASRFAYLLRSLGFYQLLQRLHRSEKIKSLVFKKQRPLGQGSEVRSQIDAESAKRIEADRRALLQRIPDLVNHWE